MVLDSVENSLMLGKTESKQRRQRQRTRWLDSITNSMDTQRFSLCTYLKDTAGCETVPEEHSSHLRSAQQEVPTTVLEKRGRST